MSTTVYTTLITASDAHKARYFCTSTRVRETGWASSNSSVPASRSPAVAAEPPAIMYAMSISGTMNPNSSACRYPVALPTPALSIAEEREQGLGIVLDERLVFVTHRRPHREHDNREEPDAEAPPQQTVAAVVDGLGEDAMQLHRFVLS